MTRSIGFTSPRRIVALFSGIASLLVVSACGSSNDSPGDAANTATQEESPSSLLQRGKTLLFNAKTRYEYPKAVELLTQAVAEDPENAEARLALVYAYAKTGKYDEAAVTIMPVRNNRDALGARDLLWLDALDAKISDQSTLEVERWLDTVEAFPNDRWAWYELATANAVIGKHSEAAAAATKALEVEPERSKWEASWIYYLQSKALFRSGQFDEAIAAGAAGRGNETTWRSTYYRMAMAEIAAGNQETAANFVDDYLTISNAEGRNNTSFTHTNIALFYYELGDYKQAITHAQRAVELEPASYQTWSLAYALTENGNPDEALMLIENAATDFPDDKHALVAKAWVLFRLGQLDLALESVLAAKSGLYRQNHYFNEVEKIIIDAKQRSKDVSSYAAPWLG